MDLGVRDAVEAIDNRRANKRIAVILDTPGGNAEVVERVVDTIRSFHDDVAFVIPASAANGLLDRTAGRARSHVPIGPSGPATESLHRAAGRLCHQSEGSTPPGWRRCPV
ncbi:MAG: hypothetical protein FJ255_01060 [Phycisphaerae bacterium]|nr:hypothetical protein [Phycisphaerae bacterium]